MMSDQFGKLMSLYFTFSLHIWIPHSTLYLDPIDYSTFLQSESRILINKARWLFKVDFDHFKLSIIFRGSWSSIENWLKHKTFATIGKFGLPKSVKRSVSWNKSTNSELNLSSSNVTTGRGRFSFCKLEFIVWWSMKQSKRSWPFYGSALSNKKS